MQEKLYGSDKNCVPKYKGFFGKKLCTCFVHYFDKLDKNIGQETPRISLVPPQGISFFSSFLTRNLKQRKMGCVNVRDTQKLPFLHFFSNQM